MTNNPYATEEQSKEILTRGAQYKSKLLNSELYKESVNNEELLVVHDVITDKKFSPYWINDEWCKTVVPKLLEIYEGSHFTICEKMNSRYATVDKMWRDHFKDIVNKPEELEKAYMFLEHEHEFFI